MAVIFQRYLSIPWHCLYTKLILACLQLQWGVVICSLGVWIFTGAKLEAATKSTSPQLYENWNSPPEFTYAANWENLHHHPKAKVANEGAFPKSIESEDSPSEFTEQIIQIASLENLHPSKPTIEGSSVPLQYRLEPPPFLLAAPENFNPSLRSPSPKPPLPTKPPDVIPPSTSTETVAPIAVLESIQTDFRNDTDNFDQTNQFIEPTAEFRLRNGNMLRVKTGFNSFSDSNVESITNIPIQVGWEGKAGQVTLQTAVGIDLFDRLPTAFNFNAKVEAPISSNVDSSGKFISGLVLSGKLEHGPYKFDAQTLDNQISNWRFGPDLYWQIDRYTSSFSSFRLGNYSDGNHEQQFFSRLERKIGQFSLAANLFNWSYARDLESESGYFSPPDFLVYNAELAWEGDVFDFLRCRLAATLGRQRLKGEVDNANGYQARCTAKLSPNIEADLGYNFSNVRNQDTGDSAYNNRSITGQLRVKF